MPVRPDMAAWIVAEQQDALIDELLALDRRLGWRRVDWAARRHWIDARFCARTGQIALVRLYPPDRRPPVEHRRTASFTVALVAGRGEGLLDALVEHLRGREQRFAWISVTPRARVEQLAVEQLAYARGLKPALRVMSAPEGLMLDATRRRTDSAMIVIDPATERGLPVMMIAQTRAEAEAMAAGHFDELSADPARNTAGTRALGRLLGYPDCCVEAFVADFACEREPPPPGVSKDAHDVWRRLDRAWVPRPAARINSLLFGERLGLISFDPCRFDCPAALARADRTHALIADDDAETAAELDRLLTRPVYLDASNRRAWVTLERRGDGVSITEAEPLRDVPDQPAPADVRAQLLGLRVDADGRVAALAGPPGRVFRFDLGAPATG